MIPVLYARRSPRYSTQAPPRRLHVVDLGERIPVHLQVELAGLEPGDRPERQFQVDVCRVGRGDEEVVGVDLPHPAEDRSVPGDHGRPDRYGADVGFGHGVAVKVGHPAFLSLPRRDRHGTAPERRAL